MGAYSWGGRLFEGWALIRGWRLFNNITSRVGVYSRGRLFEGGTCSRHYGSVNAAQWRKIG